jgi:hypothetical protein
MKWWNIIKEGGAILSSGGGTDALFNISYGGKKKDCNCGGDCKCDMEKVIPLAGAALAGTAGLMSTHEDNRKEE